MRDIPRGTRGPYGPRHHPLAQCLRAAHRRFCLWTHQRAHRHTDDFEGARLRPRGRGGHSGCRLHAQLPRLPRLRACFYDDVAGGRPRRPKGQARTGAVADEKQRPARRSAGGEERLEGFLSRPAGRAQAVPLSAFPPPCLYLPAPQDRADGRLGGHLHGLVAAPVVWRARAGPRQAWRVEGEDAAHPKDRSQIGERHRPAEGAPVSQAGPKTNLAGQAICRPASIL